MKNEVYTFLDLFTTSNKFNGIVIPRIQRDYAQGREDKSGEMNAKGVNFLNALYDSLHNEAPLDLDFIYGLIDSNNKLVPLDGQQRLTTLFLLHFYAFKIENETSSDEKFLSNFTYETRTSTNKFIEKLTTQFEYEGKKTKKKISEIIENEKWFPLSYKSDPTIKSMLTMLDKIEDKFSNFNSDDEHSSLWNTLKKGYISFHFMELENVESGNDLYIKMNSRGKQLTDFENLKVEIEDAAEKSGFNKDELNEIAYNFDKTWTDLFWSVANKSGPIDNYFLNYLIFIARIITNLNGENYNNLEGDDYFKLLNIFCKSPNAKENIKMMVTHLNCWKFKSNKTVQDFLASFMSKESGEHKIINNNAEDFLRNALENRNSMTYYNLALLYAINTYLIHYDEIDFEDFKRRIRIVNNLCANSPNELAERSDNKSGLKQILEQVEDLIRNENINNILDNVGFNEAQRKEERRKIEHLKNNPNDLENMYKLEDSPLLNGRISIVGLKNLNLTDRFIKLFDFDFKNRERLDLIDRAIMSSANKNDNEANRIGYVIKRKIGRRILYCFLSNREGAEEYKKLFAEGVSDSANRLKDSLCNLLNDNRLSNFTDDELRKVIDEYINECQKSNQYPFRYYYVKENYLSDDGGPFRPGRSGIYTDWRPNDNEYCWYALRSSSFMNKKTTYRPFLKAIDPKANKAVDYGESLKSENKTLEMANTFEYKFDNGQTIKITNDGEIDTEDRILKLKSEWENYKNS